MGSSLRLISLPTLETFLSGIPLKNPIFLGIGISKTFASEGNEEYPKCFLIHVSVYNLCRSNYSKRIEWAYRSRKERFDASMMKWDWDINLNCILVSLTEENMIFTLAFAFVDILLRPGKVSWSWWGSPWYRSGHRSFSSTCSSSNLYSCEMIDRIMISKFLILPNICSVWTIVEKECLSLTKLWKFVSMEVKLVELRCVHKDRLWVEWIWRWAP